MANKTFFEEYEDFKKNNPDVFRRMTEKYIEEEGVMTLTEEQDLFLRDQTEDAFANDLATLDIRHDVDVLDEDEEDLDGAFSMLESDYESDEDGEEDFEYEESDEEEVESEVVAHRAAEVFNESESVEEMAATPEIKNTEISPEDTNYWRTVHIVDTAGIRRKSTIGQKIEAQAVYRALRAIGEADIIVYMVDATKSISHQDRRLIDIAVDKGKSVIVCLNKIDLMKEQLPDDKAKNKWLKELHDNIPWLAHCDLIPMSAKFNKHVKQLKTSLKKTIVVRNQRIPTGELNRLIETTVDRRPIIVRGSRGKHFRVKYTAQIKSNPPTFLLFTNKSKGIPTNYQRYLKNEIRKSFSFDNTPIHLIFRTGTDLENRMRRVKHGNITNS